MKSFVLAIAMAFPAVVAAQAAHLPRFSSGARGAAVVVAGPLGNGPAAPRASNRGADAQSQDPWFGPDKVKHFFTSAALQSLGYGALRAADVEHRAAIAGASAVTAAFGIGKELHDRRRGRVFSVRDLVWNAAGAAAMSLLLERTER